MSSFIENINRLAEKLDIIIESNEIFDDGIVPVLEEIAELNLAEAIMDLKKGEYLGNRKIDINLALNMQGITEDTIKKYPDDAEDIWTDASKTVYYDKATVTFVDGEVLEIPFTFDGNPINISTHGDLLIQFNNNTAFLAKLESTLIAGFSADVVGEFVRIYDAIGQNSNIERIQLNAVSGLYKEEKPIYFWAKTTSAFRTLAMRSGDIIKLGNEIDNIILLANSIEQVLDVQERIPELVDTYTGGVPNGDLTIYNKLTELEQVHSALTELLVIYEDVKAGGNNYIQTVGNDLNSINSSVGVVAGNLQTKDTIGSVASSINNVDVVAYDINSVNEVANNIADVNIVALNIFDVQNAEENAQIATEKADIATIKADVAVSAANTATQKADKIKNVTVSNTVTAVPGSSASVVYDDTTGGFTFIIPQGAKGDKGDAFQVNAIGTLTEKSNYDDRSKGFSFLDSDNAEIYFKASDTVGDWSVPAPFGKGDKGDKGDTGTGIVNIQFTSTTDVSGDPAKSGATDTYTITYTDASTATFNVYNGLDSDVQTVAGRTGDVVLTKSDVGLANVDNTSDINKPISNATNTALANKVDKVIGKGLSTEDFTTADKTKLAGIESGAQVNVVNSVAAKTGNVILVKGDVGLGNVDNTSDLNKPISNATQTALNAKQDISTALNDSNYATKIFSDTTIDIDKTWSSDKIISSIGTVSEFEATLS
jgi:hypothetical protein